MVKRVCNKITFREFLKSLHWILCITVQLSQYGSKLGPGEISQVVYSDPLEPAIEAYLREEGGVGKTLFQAIELLVLYQKELLRE